MLALAAVAVNGLTWVALYRLVRHQTALMPLHYTIYFGPDLTVKGGQMYSLAAFGTMIILANIIASSYEDNELWRRTITTISAALNVILLAIAVTLIYVAQLSS